ncbi:hypothetical protein Tco_0396918 [Tanacetum coccineum]
MAISGISISSDSSEESVGTSTARVILFGMISTAIPATIPIVDPPVVHDDTPLILSETSTIAPVFTTLPHTSLFLYTDSFDSDTSKRPPSKDPYKVTVARRRSRVAARSSPPTHDIPPTDITPPIRQILPAPPSLPHRPTILVLPGQLILVGRPYCTQPNRVCNMLTSRKRNGPLPNHRLALRSPNTSVPLATPVPRALSPVHTDLLPPCKRIRGSVSTTDYGVSLEESYKTNTEPGIDFDVQADIDACIAAVDSTTARETDVRVEFGIETEEEAEEEAEFSARGIIEIRMDKIGLDVVMQELYDHMVEISVRRIKVIESVQRDQGHRMMTARQQSTAMSKRIGTLERDNMKLRALLCIERDRMDSLRRHMAYTQEELRQIRRFRYYDHVRFGRLETYARRHLGYCT